tara:strand:- start:1788 stop:3284 length:1497 start_codon:yes stop_codon:yes gene_type:complete
MFSCVLLLLIAPPQVHYYPNGSPWNRRADNGPDAEVPGWFYNLGVTGIRCELTEEHPKALVVRHVFSDSPSHKKVKIGDLVIGVSGNEFKESHQNGYGMNVFGARGPISEIAQEIQICQGNGSSLPLLIQREGKRRVVKLKLKKRKNFLPEETLEGKNEEDSRLPILLDYLTSHQREDGSWGSPPHDTFAPLALMSSPKKRHRDAVLRNVRMHARTTKSKDESWLINWRYMSAGIVLSEYYLKTGEKWLLPELQEIYEFLISSQYVNLIQLNPKSHETHPHAVPKTPLDSHGGWGHNPGFEGYGPISMLTAQGALVFALMKRCGLDIDRERHDAAYAFLRRASGDNFYVWYEDQAAGPKDWADMGRTGTAAIAFQMSPWSGEHREISLKYAELIGKHPESFPDTHGSPVMGMAFGALGAFCEPSSFEKLMSKNQWWFTLSECTDGSFYYQPNRDNAGYGADSRISASAAVAFILSLPKQALAVTGKKSDFAGKSQKSS